MEISSHTVGSRKVGDDGNCTQDRGCLCIRKVLIWQGNPAWQCVGLNETLRVAQEAINAYTKHPDHLKLFIMTIFSFTISSLLITCSKLNLGKTGSFST